MKVKIAGKFLEDWSPASEELFASAEAGTESSEWITLIEKMYNAPKIKCGKGYRVMIEVTEIEKELLRGEAIYRMEFWSLLYQDCRADIDQAAHNAAERLLAQLV